MPVRVVVQQQLVQVAEAEALQVQAAAILVLAELRATREAERPPVPQLG